MSDNNMILVLVILVLVPE